MVDFVKRKGAQEVSVDKEGPDGLLNLTQCCKISKS